MRPKVRISKTALTILLKLVTKTNFYLFFRIYQSLTTEKLMEVQIWQPNFGFWKCVTQKNIFNDFLQTPNKNFPLNALSDIIVFLYREMYRNLSLSGQFSV